MKNWVRHSQTVAAIREEASVEYSRLDTRLMGTPETGKTRRARLQVPDWCVRLHSWVPGTVQAVEVEMHPATMTNLTNDTMKMQARQTCFILATPTSAAALHIVRTSPTHVDLKHGDNCATDMSQQLVTEVWRVRSMLISMLMKTLTPSSSTTCPRDCHRRVPPVQETVQPVST